MKEKPILEQPGYYPDLPFSTSTPVITNYDRFVGKTPEEMADWFANLQFPERHAREAIRKLWLDWLKSPAEEAVP